MFPGHVRRREELQERQQKYLKLLVKEWLFDWKKCGGQRTQCHRGEGGASHRRSSMWVGVFLVIVKSVEEKRRAGQRTGRAHTVEKRGLFKYWTFQCHLSSKIPASLVRLLKPKLQLFLPIAHSHIQLLENNILLVISSVPCLHPPHTHHGFWRARCCR